MVGHGGEGRVSISLTRQAASESELIGNTRVLIEEIFPKATWLRATYVNETFIGDVMGIEYNDMTLDVMRQSYDFMMIVDIEHTCSHDGSIPPEEREIIELGAVVVDIKSLEIIDDFSALVKP